MEGNGPRITLKFPRKDAEPMVRELDLLRLTPALMQVRFVVGKRGVATETGTFRVLGVK
jgi:hypothetical protein